MCWWLKTRLVCVQHPDAISAGLDFEAALVNPENVKLVASQQVHNYKSSSHALIQRDRAVCVLSIPAYMTVMREVFTSEAPRTLERCHMVMPSFVNAIIAELIRYQWFTTVSR